MLKAFHDYRDRQLNVHALGITVSLAGVLVIAPMLPEIIDEFDITPAVAGGSISFMWACNALAQYPGGRYSERLTSSVVLLASQGLMIVGFLLLMFSSAFWIFIAGLGFIGFGYGMFEPAGIVLIRDLFEENRGHAFGIRDAAANLGSALSAVLAITVVGAAAWRNAFLPVVVLLGAVAVSSHRLNRESYAVSRVALNIPSVCARLFRSRKTYANLFVLAVFNFIWQGSASFLPTFLRVEKSFTTFEATVAFASMFVIGMLVTPVAGVLCERRKPVNLGLGATGFGIVGLVVLIGAESLIGLGVGLFIFAVGLTTIWPIMYVYLVETLAKQTMGTDLGALRAVYFAIGSLGPAYVGTVATRFGYTDSFASLLLFFILTALALLWIARH
ncbi:MFS transporter [Natronorubrum aibiense]|uniref:MFS transporter n=1 Tax=Natronorubrum aibiense TaxID=348826 RepID=A0A5P9P9B7_9EURY|nr:MFS transporter [Natronorubrum aibiense]QFU84716.1 MFS transporter [Natronorubrum aibiense]